MIRFLRNTLILMMMTTVKLEAQTPWKDLHADARAAAHLVDVDEVAWDPPDGAGVTRITMHFSGPSDPDQMEEVPLAEIPPAEQAALPAELEFLAKRRRFRATGSPGPTTAPALVLASRLRGRLVIAAWKGEHLVASTGLQTFPAIDRHLAYEGQDLGVTFLTGTTAPRFRVWAPTARRVRLLIFDAKAEEERVGIPMESGAGGTWTATGPDEWYGKSYLYEVEAYSRALGRIETHRVTDPYSVALTTNGRRSLVVKLDDPALVPEGWETVAHRTVEDPVDMALYELHVRDFSVSDPAVPARLRGTYRAFDLEDTHGSRHLESLAKAGMTHVHLLPCFDFATVEEDRSRWKPATVPADLPADSELPQKLVLEASREDGYNWGYDPAHWGAPEGSYATDAEGPARVREFRQMVKGLHRRGLGVVMDVVYNHTHTAGLGPRSNLDPLVPDYYYRLDAQGHHQSTSCCPDTASEHRMMEKLMIDTLLRWVIHYKVSGFRFDLMGHHTRANMEHFRQALDRLTPEQHGVDGRRVWFYGEGWRFGSLEAILPGQAMHQANARGSGVGTFNDRLRDCLRGGDFTMATRADQGFATGLAGDFNAAPGVRLVPADPTRRVEFLRNETDTIRLGMAGNLADFPLPRRGGGTRPGSVVTYRTQPGAGYAKDPRETVSYVAAHDNGTLFDHLMAKAPRTVAGREPPGATREDLVDMQVLAIGVVALSQGIPFFHAGDELLRSKSGDWDSYESGDWFNRLDFTGTSNNWGVGLPPAEKNRDHWDFWKERLTDPAWRMRPEDIQHCSVRFRELLGIRRSSPLFRLRTGEMVIERLRFLDTEDEGPPGLIAFEIADRGDASTRLDPERAGIMVLVNAHRLERTFSHEGLRTRPWRLHPVLTTSVDPRWKRVEPAAGSIPLPGRTIVVLEEPR